MHSEDLSFALAAELPLTDDVDVSDASAGVSHAAQDKESTRPPLDPEVGRRAGKALQKQKHWDTFQHAHLADRRMEDNGKCKAQCIFCNQWYTTRDRDKYSSSILQYVSTILKTKGRYKKEASWCT